MYIRVPHVCLAHVDVRRAPKPLELELEKVVNHRVEFRRLGTELVSSVRATGVPNHWATSSAPSPNLFVIYVEGLGLT